MLRFEEFQSTNQNTKANPDNARVKTITIGAEMLTAADLYSLQRAPEQMHVSPSVPSVHPTVAPVSAQDNVVALIPARNKKRIWLKRFKGCILNDKFYRLQLYHSLITDRQFPSNYFTIGKHLTIT